MQSSNHVEEVAGLAAALADTTRVRLLMRLTQGAATVSDLSELLNLPQPRVSSHLARLRRAGLVAATTSGRQRSYRAEPTAARLLGAFASATTAPPRSQPASREVLRDTPLRRARTCYDHLAGVAGVALLDSLLAERWLTLTNGTKPAFALSRRGELQLAERGVDLAAARAARRAFAAPCLDWTERRPHLGGALGAQVLAALEVRGFAERERGSRALQPEPAIGDWLAGMRPSAGSCSPR